MKNLLLYTFVISLFFSCQRTTKKEVNDSSSKLKYATGFQIEKDGEKKILIINTPYQNAKNTASYTFRNSDSSKAIKLPLKKVVVTSTTHIPMIELLEEENSIIGFPNSEYISAEKTRKRIEEGFISEVGIQGSLNTEVLLALEPDAVISYAVTTPDKSLEVIKRSGIPVIYNGDWLEEKPLGRAEWLKFFGLLYDKEAMADSIFSIIEQNYIDAKELAQKSTKKPRILSGAVMNGDSWNLPAGKSFVAQFLADANSNYLWKDSDGKGSLTLSFESVFEKSQNADFWIAPGYFSSKGQMLTANKLYAEFRAFKNDQIYTPSTKKGPSGGVLYYELASVRPDLVLKDLIKILHPELLPDYELTFFEKMK